MKSVYLQWKIISKNLKNFMQKPKSIYLPGLNGIRAIAAISVIISHIGLNLKLYNLSNFGGYAIANFGVTMFFALSGFLITYLLLKEKRKNQYNCNSEILLSSNFKDLTIILFLFNPCLSGNGFCFK